MDKLITIWSSYADVSILSPSLHLLIIIGFLDENSLFRRIWDTNEISQLKEEIEKYRADYEENTKRLNELNSNRMLSNRWLLREKYLMKSPT